jgi:DnaJ-class molecular chaperone
MDYYSLLGVSKTDDIDTIKKAYRKLAMKHHPDRGGDQETFQEIQKAYDTLSDPEKRAAYDNPQPNFSGEGVNPFHDEMMSHVFNDLFRQHGVHFSFGGGRRPQPKNKDLQIKLEIPLIETLHDQTKSISVLTSIGTRTPIDIQIPRGVPNGARMKYAGFGDDANPNLPKGDLYVYIEHIIPSDVTVYTPDIMISLPITCFEAAVGCEKIIKSPLEGKELKITIPAGIEFNTKLLVRGHGLALHGTDERGHLVVNTQIEIPKNLTEAQKELIKNNFIKG